MKKNLQLLLVMIVSILTSSLSSFAYDFEVDGIYYNIISAADRTCEVTSGDVKYEGDIVIPSSVVYKNNTVSVISIGSDAFRYCSSLTSIVIPNSVISIGWNAFASCSSLTSIEIPSSVTEIGYYAFYNCSSLTSIGIPNSVTSIRDSAFASCSSLTSIVIPNSVTSIGDSVFKYCSSLTSIVIPNSVTSIEHDAFAYCTSLSEIQLSENLTRLDYGLFKGCTSLQSLTIPGSIRSIVFYEEWSNDSFTPTFSSSIKSLRFDYSDESFEILYYLRDHLDYYSTYWSAKTVSTFTNQIENLYIDREFGETRGLSFRSLTDLIVGEHITDWPIAGRNMPEIESITCYATTPPTTTTFTDAQYAGTLVKVPYEALEAYKNADVWKNFWNIEGFDPAGVDDVTTDLSGSSRKEVSRYNLNGQAVSEDYKGVVIVRFSDGKTKKIMQ